MSLLQTKVNSKRPLKLFEFTNGIDLDQHLADQEVKVQLAWVNALKEANYLSSDEALKAQSLLKEALQKIHDQSFDWQIADEDIHMNLERYLTQNSDALGKKIHYGRSRNDLIATTLKLFVSDALKQIASCLNTIIENLNQQAEQQIDVLVPGMTHMQHGQPIRLAQILLAHAQAFLRDQNNLKNNIEQTLKNMPLGAAAFAGTTLNLNFEKLAKDLGFANVCENGFDAVSERDFILNGLNSLSLLGVHLSRLCEDCLYYSSTAVGLLELPKNWSTGSSIMPNKRNPDVPELTRAKSARLIAMASEGANLVRSVATSYGSDLHELKRTFLTSFKEALACLKVLDPFLKEMNFNKSFAEKLLNTGHILATEMANHAVENGKTFREAYQNIAKQVEDANKQQKQVHEISNQKFSFLDAVEARCYAGGTAKAQIEKQIQNLKQTLKENKNHYD